MDIELHDDDFDSTSEDSSDDDGSYPVLGKRNQRPRLPLPPAKTRAVEGEILIAAERRNQEVNIIKHDFNKYQSSLTKLLQRNHALQNEVDGLKDKAKDLLEQIEVIQGVRDADNNLDQQLGSNQDSFNQGSEAVLAEKEAIQVECNALKDQLQEALAILEENMYQVPTETASSRSPCLKERLRALLAVKASMQEECDSLKKELDEALAINDQISSAREEAVRKVDCLNATIKAVEETNADLMVKLNAAVAQRNSNQEASARAINLEHELLQSTAEKVTIQEECDKLKEQLQEFFAAREADQQRIYDLSQHLKSAEDARRVSNETNSVRAADLEAELNALATEKASVQEECDSAKEKLREALAMKQDFERSYEKHTRALAASNEQKVDLISQLQASRASSNRLQSDLTSKDRELSEIRLQYSVISAQFETSQSELNESKRSLNTLHAEFQAANERHHIHLNEIRNAHETVAPPINMELLGYRVDYSRLEELLRISENATRDLKMELSALRSTPVGPQAATATTTQGADSGNGFNV